MEWIAEWGLVVVFLGVLLESAGLPLPAEMVVLAAGFYWRGLPLWGVIPVAALAAIAGDLLAYAAGRRGGKEAALRHHVLLRMTPARMASLTAYFKTHPAASFAARWITGLRAYAALFAGITRVPFARFVRQAAGAAVLWATAMALAGAFFQVLSSVLRDAIGIGGVFALGLALGLGLLVLLWRHGRRVVAGASQHLPLRELVLGVANLSAIGLFAVMADEVEAQRLNAFDEQVSMWLHAHASLVLDWWFRSASTIGGYWFLIAAVLVVTLLAAWRRDYRAAITLPAIAIASQVLNHSLKSAFARARPALWEGAYSVHYDSFSFPSGHSMVGATCWAMMAIVLVRLRPGLKRLALVVTPAIILSIGVSRVYLGAHWPTDVMAGFVAGTFLAALGLYAIGQPRDRTVAAPITASASV